MVSRDTWDARLRENGGHLLQSWAWGEFKQQGGWCPERVMVDTADGLAMAQVLFRSAGPISIGYIPRGPMLVGDAGALWPRLRDEIDRKARRRRAISVIIEADRASVLSAAWGDGSLATGPCNIQPGRTVKVPLLGDDALLKQMHQKTRYNVRLAPRRGVRVEPMQPTDANLAAFHGLMVDTSERNRFPIHPLSYYAGALRAFGTDASLFGAWTEEGHLAASLIVVRYEDEAIYLYGASSTRHRAHGAGLAIQFAAMQWARDRGAKVYDLWGIPRQDPDSTTEGVDHHIAGTSGNDWRGLYRFKTGFGGDIVSYPEPVERRYVWGLPSLARRFGLIPG